MISNERNPQPPLEIPKEQLSPEALYGLIEAFVLREGTDYGREEVSLAKKVDQIQRQLDRQEIKIVFDPETESATLMTNQEWRKRNQSVNQPR